MSEQATLLVHNFLGLQRQRKSALVTVRAEGVTTLIYFRNGRVAFAEQGGLSDTLGRLLVEIGSIDQQQYSHAVQIMTDNLVNSESMRLGEVLVALGHVEVPQIQEALVEQVRRKIARVFQWMEPAWEIDLEAERLADVPNYPMRIEPILLSSVRRFYGPARIEGILGAYIGGPLKLRAEAGLIKKVFELNPADVALARSIHGGDSIGEWLEANNTDEAWQLLAALAMTGVLMVDPSSSAAVAPASEPVPRQQATPLPATPPPPPTPTPTPAPAPAPEPPPQREPEPHPAAPAEPPRRPAPKPAAPVAAAKPAAPSGPPKGISSDELMARLAGKGPWQAPEPVAELPSEPMGASPEELPFEPLAIPDPLSDPPSDSLLAEPLSDLLDLEMLADLDHDLEVFDAPEVRLARSMSVPPPTPAPLAPAGTTGQFDIPEVRQSIIPPAASAAAARAEPAAQAAEPAVAETRRRLDAEAAHHRGLTLIEIDHFEDATTEFRNASELMPQLAEYALYQAWAEIRTTHPLDEKPLNEAMAMKLEPLAVTAAKQDSRHAFPPYVMGHVCLGLGDEVRAGRYFTIAHRRNPTNRDAEKRAATLSKK